MKKLALACLVLLGACFQNENKSSQHIIDSSQETPYVFVLSSPSGIYSDEKLTLIPVPVVVYFSDRPHLVGGHIKIKDFINKWSSIKGHKEDDSPSAVLSIVNADSTTEVLIELSEPKLLGNQLTMKVEKKSGQIPATFGANSIFIEMKGLKAAETTAEPEDKPATK